MNQVLEAFQEGEMLQRDNRPGISLHHKSDDAENAGQRKERRLFK